jgi:hypothetical protein
MGLFQSHISGLGLDKLTQVNSVFFLYNFFFPIFPFTIGMV